VDIYEQRIACLPAWGWDPWLGLFPYGYENITLLYYTIKKKKENKTKYTASNIIKTYKVYLEYSEVNNITSML